MTDYSIQKLNALSCPKGQLPMCELTGKPAKVQLVTPHVTLYYGSREHAELAWESIVHKIHHLLGPLQAVPSAIGSSDERARHTQSVLLAKHALIKICNSEAKKHLVKRKYDHAIPGALRCLKFSVEMYGQGRMELVRPYLLLAEATLGLARYREAEEYLSLANWIVLKNPECSNALKSQLRRRFGMLYSAQGKYGEALRQLGNDIYYSSLMVGPENIETAGGFFQMGNVFYAMDQMENALAMYDKVVDIWYKCLANVLSAGQNEEGGENEELGEAQGAEGIETLTQILLKREECVGENNIATGESYYILALLFQYFGDVQQALEKMSKALSLYENQLGAEHHSTQDVAKSLAQLKESMN